ncbi:hypothetical protein BH09BAC5_BH09BAC5_08650 [soil metagenome]
MRKLYLSFLLFFLVSTCFAITIQKDSLRQHDKPDSLFHKGIFELSFGQSLLFISNSQLINIHNNAAIVIPTSAMLFFVELRPMKFIRIPVFFNLPTESKQFLVAGQIVNERASPTFGTGLEFKCFRARVAESSHIELEAGPLASFLMTTKNSIRFAPIGAARVRLVRNNFVMYVGTSYSIGINSWGILYGTGTVF